MDSNLHKKKPAAVPAHKSAVKPAGAAAVKKPAVKKTAAAKTLSKKELRRRKQRNQMILGIGIAAALLIAAVGGMLLWNHNNDDPSAEPTGTPAAVVLNETATPEPTQEILITPTPAAAPTDTPEPTETPVPTPSPKPTPTPKPVKLDLPYLIDIDKTNQVLTVYTIGETGYYDLIVKQFICSTGHCDKVEDGMYTLGEKYRWKEMGNGSFAQYASRISGPYLIHSCCYYSQNPGKMKTRYYDNLGTNASSGCVRLAAGNAYWIYKNCPKGTPIHVHYSDAVDEELRARLAPIPYINQNWDPTDPECKAKYAVTPAPDTTPDPTPVPGVTPAPTPKWTVHPVLKAWGYC